MSVIVSTQLASWILYLFILTVRAQPDCKHDDCYNALFRCDSPLALAEALNYCATVGHYGATDYPAFATAACGNTNKRAYISACQCGVACPSLQPATVSSSTTVLTLTTLTTSTIAPGGGQSSPGFSIPATPATLISSDSVRETSASSSGVFSSAISGNPSLGSSASQGSSLSIVMTSSNSGSYPSSKDTALSTRVTVSDPESALTAPVSPTTTSLSTTSVSDGPLSIPLNTSSALSSTSSDLSGGESSGTLLTVTSYGSHPATISSSFTVSSSSALWTNTSRTSGVGFPTSANISTASSTLLDQASTSASSSIGTSSSGDPIGGNSTVSFNSATDASIPLPRPTSIDTTCTSTPTPTPSTPCHSSFSYFPNSTATHNPAPSVTKDVISASAFGVSSWPSLNHTSSSTLSTSKSSASPSCTSSSSSKMIENGDFERGLSPWSIDMVDIMSTSYSVARPGANGSCGAFHVHMRRNSQTDDLRANLRLVSPLISPPAQPGASWAVSFWVRFGSGRATNSYVNLFANGEVAHRVDAADEGATNWTRVEFPYTTASTDHMLQLVFSFALGNAPYNDVWIDKVAMDVKAINSTPVGQGFAVATSKAYAS
ncbi:hypothetical protein F5Y11DRAFT_157826 [Daldinia sp. FL1419]|nr:hypothetical protein F5Y11DRAFT_157826 [Daldinia sp. FL1419]